jgi:hypothetical protein
VWSAIEFLKVGNTRPYPEPSDGSKALWKSYQRGLSNVAKPTITASFAPNGNLCRAHINSDADAKITDKHLNAVLDELAPKEVRGEFKMDTFLNITCIKLVKPENSTSNSSKAPAPELEVDPCSECSGVSDDYERVKITKYGNTNRYSSVQITFKQPECEGLDKVHQ